MSWVGFAIGVGLALFTWATVMNTLVFTRGPVPLVERGVILGLRRAYVWAAPRIRRYERRDNFLATLAPLALLMHLACWLTLFFGAYALMLWPFVDGGLSEGLRASGSSLFTLGVSGPGGPAPTALILVTATTGIVVIALYIAYLPTLYEQVNSRETKELRLVTEPGDLLIFNGDKLWHAVTPLGEGEERIVLTMEYLTSQEMGAFKRLYSNLKDAFAYFGLKAVFGGSSS